MDNVTNIRFRDSLFVGTDNVTEEIVRTKAELFDDRAAPRAEFYSVHYSIWTKRLMESSRPGAEILAGDFARATTHWAKIAKLYAAPTGFELL